jgi:uncharacterized protein (DUF302 family)
VSYYYNRTVSKTFEDTISELIECLKKEGFGVLTQINIADKFKEKLGINFRNYVILGACNPTFAYKALQIEDKIGVMLPCNIIVQETPTGKIEIAAIDPRATIAALGNEALAGIASEVNEKLNKALDSV